MALPGRTFSSSAYRYGFNGKEKDKDIAGDNYDFGARIYDGRIGRWLAVDPLQYKYPFSSPFAFGLNNPILYIDPDGKEIIIGESVANVKFWNTFLNKTFENQVEFQVKRNRAGDYIFTMELKEGGQFKSQEAKAAYEYMKKIADDPSKIIRVNSWWLRGTITDGNLPENRFSSPDNYEESRLFFDYIETMMDDGFGYHQKGGLFLHFLAEQVYGQTMLPYGTKLNNGTNYYEAHQYALDEVKGVLGYYYSMSVEKTDGDIKVEDADILNADGTYKTTIRIQYDFSAKNKPKRTITSGPRKGMVENGVYTPNLPENPIDQDREKYWQDNPINTPRLEPGKKKEDTSIK